MENDLLRTSTMLIRSMAEGQDPAWERFFELYYRIIINWATRLGCPIGMEDDVFQEVVVALLQQLETFDYDKRKGSFRGFLKTVTKRKVYDIYRRRREVNPSQYEDASEGMGRWEDRVADDRPDVRGDALDYVSLRIALHTAMTVARGRVQPRTAQMFEMYRVQGRPPEEVAAELGVQVQTVYEAARRFRSEHLVPAFLQVIDELDDSIADGTRLKLLDQALDDWIKGDTQLAVTLEAEAPRDLKGRLDYLRTTIDLTEVPPVADAWLVLLELPPGSPHTLGQQVLLQDEVLRIGRIDGLGIVLPSTLVSGHHASVYRDDDDWYLRDEDSRNGTYLNSTKLLSPIVLHAGDIIQVGDYCLAFLTREPMDPGDDAE